MTKLISHLSLVITLISLTSVFNYIVETSATRTFKNESNERRHCDKKVCDEIVTKCKLSRRCSCGVKFGDDPSCNKDCIDCLEEKFNKCCACVDICPVIGDNVDPSHVGSISPTTDEQLFSVLTESDDIHGRWNVHSIPTDVVEPSNGKNNDNSLDERRCLMAFINKHLHMDQCKRYCRAMGASYFQWFHDGCCECAGKYCHKYGIPQPKCMIDPE